MFFKYIKNSVNILNTRKIIIFIGLALLITLVVFKGVYISTYRIPGMPEATLSALDIFIDPLEQGIYSTDSFLLFIIPILLIWILASVKIMENSNYILRQDNRQAIWKNYRNILFFLVLLLTCVFMFSGYITALVLTQNPSLNWTQDGGLMYFAAQQTNSIEYLKEIQTNISCFKIFITAFIKLFLFLFQAGLFVLLAKTILKKNILVIVVMIIFLYIKPINTFFLTRFAGLNFFHWGDNYLIISEIAFLILGCFILNILGNLYIKHYEYYGS